MIPLGADAFPVVADKSKSVSEENRQRDFFLW